MRGQRSDLFAKTVQKSEEWIKDLCEIAGWEFEQQAYHAFRAVIHALRDHLPIGEAIHLGAQLPMLLRVLYYEGWGFHPKADTAETLDEFLDQLKMHYVKEPDVDLERIVRNVLELLSRRISAGEIADVIQCLPKELKTLWPDGALRHAMAELGAPV